jgi:hypothetical protein
MPANLAGILAMLSFEEQALLPLHCAVMNGEGGGLLQGRRREGRKRNEV